MGKTSYILMISDVFFLLDQPNELDFFNTSNTLKQVYMYTYSHYLDLQQIVFIFSLLNAAWLAEMKQISI